MSLRRALPTIAMCLPLAPVSAQTLLSWMDRPPAGDTTVVVRAFASGNIRGVATGASDEGSANGSVGVSMTWPRVSVAGVINVVTSLGRQTSGFGQAILSPGTGTGLRSGVLEVRVSNVARTFVGPIGLHVYASASSNSWSPATDTLRAKAAAVTGLGATVYRQVAASNGENRMSFGLEAGASIRNLSGDISSYPGLRDTLLGTRTKLFGGLEGGMTLSVNKLTASVQLYYYRPRGVLGLSNVQVTTGLSIQSDLFSFRSRPEDR